MGNPTDRAAGTRSGLGLAGRVVAASLYATWSAAVIATPLLGVWVSSSLAAYRNGPVWASAVIGLALFPLLPLAWDRLGSWLRDRKNPDRRRWLTFWDRFTLRTLVVNLAFLGVVLAAYPEAGFRALSTRGDWMLDGRTGPAADLARRQLFRLADTLEWLYRTQRDNPYRKYADDDADLRPEPVPTPPAADPDPGDDVRDPDPGDDVRDPDPGDPGDHVDDVRDPDSGDVRVPDTADVGAGTAGWPMAEALHPVVASMPAEVETDHESVARYIADRVTDPFGRVKALHDYVADRIAYDAPALARGDYPPQDAETVFRTRLGVCAGYSKLLQAMGKVTGDEIAYVVGDSRTQGDSVDGVGHAWNAARIDGRWYLIDATWDSGHLDGAVFEKRYSTDHLFTPPEIFGLTHLPDADAWQLRAAPITRGDFMRQPQLAPAFFRHGLRLVSPTRSQVTVSDRAELEMDNPRGVFLMAFLIPKSGGSRSDCEVRSGRDARVLCAIPGRGTYQVQLFTGTKRYGTYQMTGQLEVNSR